MPHKAARLCELNVLEQAHNVCRTTIVQDAWKRGQALAIHAWIYGLSDGLVRDLGLSVSTGAEARHRFDGALERITLPAATMHRGAG